jgi:hypothetical protein
MSKWLERRDGGLDDMHGLNKADVDRIFGEMRELLRKLAIDEIDAREFWIQYAVLDKCLCRGLIVRLDNLDGLPDGLLEMVSVDELEHEREHERKLRAFMRRFGLDGRAEIGFGVICFKDGGVNSHFMFTEMSNCEELLGTKELILAYYDWGLNHSDRSEYDAILAEGLAV